ncbi:MAG: DUF1207 domain-containing protein [Candidatus Thermochlorobacter sp.]
MVGSPIAFFFEEFMRIFFTLLFVLCAAPLFAQSTRFAFLKSNFEPLLADPKETRIAVLTHLNDTGLLLDIGASLDLLQVDVGQDSLHFSTFGFGADFGTFSLLRRLDAFKFPVDAADYIFGINISWRSPLQTSAFPLTISGRLRLSHISAHLIDGSFDLDRLQWREGRLPFTFSREFIHLTLALSSSFGRVYLGYEWLFNTVPVDVARHSAQAGLEVFMPLRILIAFAPFLACDVRLSPIWRAQLGRTEGYGTTLSFQAGIKTGDFGARGVRLTYHYYTGLSWRGMYFGESVNVSAIGLMMDF